MYFDEMYFDEIVELVESVDYNVVVFCSSDGDRHEFLKKWMNLAINGIRGKAGILIYITTIELKGQVKALLM